VPTQDDPPAAVLTTQAWRTAAGERWLRHADRLEATLEPVLAPLLHHAALQPGERVLDVGCGRGATTRAAARAVGPDGTVTAVDVAADLLAAAAALPPEPDTAPVEWVVADAQRVDLPRDTFDVLVSRFGVMFFDDPVAAFAHLRTALRPGGRMAVVTWRPRDRSAFQSVGLTAMVTALRAHGYHPAVPEPDAGAYSFGVDARVHELLAAAGWTDVAVHSLDLPLRYGGPGATPAEAVAVTLDMTGTRAMLEPLGEAAREVATVALLDAYTRHHDGSGIPLDAALAVVTARR
jgi:SAM-dependent methyltransferase